MRARSILLDEGGDSFSENDLDWDRLERTGCDMFKPFGKDFVGINDADDDATNVAHDNPEEAENSFDTGAAAREVEGAVVEQSEEFKRQVRKIVGDSGNEISLDKACLEIRRGELRKTTERNLRVQGKAKAAGTRAPTVVSQVRLFPPATPRSSSLCQLRHAPPLQWALLNILHRLMVIVDSMRFK
jgi:hypothetical protein